MHVRKSMGHLHCYTKDLALEMLAETSYDVLDWRYTGAAFNSPSHSLKTRVASLPRRIVNALNRDFGLRPFGGDTLLALARSAT